MNKTVVLNVVGLTQDLLKQTTFLKKWSEEASVAAIDTLLPAVTCSVQATYITGKYPSEHGIVGNGWYFREECEVKFWKQSNKLMEGPKIWDEAKAMRPDFTCLNMFWWYNMYSTVDYSVTPRPQYLSDGRKLPDVYSFPFDLRDTLQEKLGTFPLFDFWGPRTSIRSSQWIADASILADGMYDPTLTLIYLPHLDYNLQRYGKDAPIIAQDLKEIDQVCSHLISYYESQGASVLVLSEYGITNVHRPIALNRIFRQHDLLSVRTERGLELLDAGASKVFAVADHQIAHIYLNDKSQMENIKRILHKTPGIEMILDEEGKRNHHLLHERSGDLIAIADKDSWFSYYYWFDDAKAPDFARTVDIHKKPGYDPVEMLINPTLSFVSLRILWKLLKKKLGFRVLMDVIPLDDTLIKGSHGRRPESDQDKALIVSKQKELITQELISPVEVYTIIKKTLGI